MLQVCLRTTFSLGRKNLMFTGSNFGSNCNESPRSSKPSRNQIAICEVDLAFDYLSNSVHTLCNSATCFASFKTVQTFLKRLNTSCFVEREHWRDKILGRLFRGQRVLTKGLCLLIRESSSVWTVWVFSSGQFCGFRTNVDLIPASVLAKDGFHPLCPAS